MTPLRYLTPFVFLALLPLGAWLGGAWTLLAAAATPIGLMSLDVALGKDGASLPVEHGAGPRWFPRMYIVAQLVASVWVATLVARGAVTWFEELGLVLSTGVTTGVFGFVAAHEMIHSPDRRERALGLMLLGTVGYMHFRISHVYGHHRRAATREDPATARLGEPLYAFLPRTVVGQFREAWEFESRRLRRTGRGILGRENRMIGYILVETAFVLAVALASLKAAVFLIAVALVSIALLETFNYVAHYGLTRRTDSRGRLERLAPHHSWNSAMRMNNAALFNMGRHSDHHRVMTRSYERLEPLAGAAELPSGYAAALLTALVPPLWRRLMDRRAEAVMSLQAGTP
jgi:alkane 1-monooxygenase